MVTLPEPDDGDPLVFDLESRTRDTGMGRARRFRPRTVAASVGAIGAMIAVPLLWTTDGGSSVGSDDAVPRGAELFVAHGCASCHSLDASEIGVGPPLAGAGSWAGDRRPGLAADEYLQESIRDPAAFISPLPHSGSPGGGGMPNLNVSDDEIDALVAFLLER